MVLTKAHSAIKIAREQGVITLLLKIYKMYLRELVAIILTYVPRSNNGKLVVFGTRYGREYEDNPKYIYEWFIKNDSDVSPVWSTKNDEVYHELSKRGWPVVHQDSTRGISILMRASVGVVINDIRDIKLSTVSHPENLCILRAGHDYPISKTAFSREHNQQKKDKEQQKYSSIDYFIHTSEYQISLWRQRRQHLPNNSFDNNKHIVCGYPRNDSIMKTPNMHDIFNRFHKDLSNKKLILYTPTKRNPTRWNEPVNLFPFTDYDPDSLNKFLQTHNMILLLRLHPQDLHYLNRKKYPEWSNKLRVQLNELESKSNVIRADHATIPDIYPMLGYVNYMITDYSSIFFDFLLLDRPVLFFAEDYEMFLENKGEITFDYFETIPGPHIESFDEFCGYIDSCEMNEDPFDGKRKCLLNDIHYFQDGDSTKRAARVVEDLAHSCALEYTLVEGDYCESKQD